MTRFLRIITVVLFCLGIGFACGIELRPDLLTVNSIKAVACLIACTVTGFKSGLLEL